MGLPNLTTHWTGRGGTGAARGGRKFAAGFEGECRHSPFDLVAVTLGAGDIAHVASENELLEVLFALLAGKFKQGNGLAPFVNVTRTRRLLLGRYAEPI